MQKWDVFRLKEWSSCDVCVSGVNWIEWDDCDLFVFGGQWRKIIVNCMIRGEMVTWNAAIGMTFDHVGVKNLR